MIFIVAALIANVLEKSKTDKMARWIFPISFTVLREIFKIIFPKCPIHHSRVRIESKHFEIPLKFNLFCILYVNEDV